MTRAQRLVLVASILGSSVAFLEMSVVNVALPAIRKDLGGGISAQQWTVDAYMLTLGSFILLAARCPTCSGASAYSRPGWSDSA
jgi:MFS family permease